MLVCVCVCVCLGVGVACRNACINKFDIGVLPCPVSPHLGPILACLPHPKTLSRPRTPPPALPFLDVCGIHIIVGHVSYECKLDANVNNLRGWILMRIQSVLATCRADVAAGVVGPGQSVGHASRISPDRRQKVYPVFLGIAAGSVPHKCINAGQPFRLKTFMCCTVERTTI